MKNGCLWIKPQPQLSSVDPACDHGVIAEHPTFLARDRFDRAMLLASRFCVEYRQQVMPDVTQILSKIAAGDQLASRELLPLVYDELRKLAAARMAQENPGQTLQATALVHEAYVRLVDNCTVPQAWDSRGHFFAAAAEAMRRILVNARLRLDRSMAVAWTGSLCRTLI